jgi:hypothetical protein
MGELVPQWTIDEACDWLDPEISPRVLGGIVQLLRIPPGGSRKRGGPGRPVLTYDIGELQAVHAALSPWLPVGKLLEGPLRLILPRNTT